MSDTAIPTDGFRVRPRKLQDAIDALRAANTLLDDAGHGSVIDPTAAKIGTLTDNLQWYLDAMLTEDGQPLLKPA